MIKKHFEYPKSITKQKYEKHNSKPKKYITHVYYRAKTGKQKELLSVGMKWNQQRVCEKLDSKGGGTR